MFDIFPDQPSYEFPSLVNILYALTWAFILSSIIAITHKLTFRGDNYPKNFFQSMILGAIVTTMVMMAIGDSLARGLGVFGAMAIIRFRTRIDDPRDVLFLFAALSNGIAIGVYGYSISFAGTMVFCLVAALLNFTSFKSYNQKDVLNFSLSNTDFLLEMQKIMDVYCRDYGLMNVSINREKETRYEYFVVMIHPKEKDKLLQEMSKVESVNQLKITNMENNN
ncbi:MAG TPA: DUF4956 domain-containing protein [Cytophagales bacterium]|nr:DUF4956 domain-containing protein [Cytophagales bacterium]